VQEAFVHTIPGLEQARFLQYGYAVEYDFVMPHQLDAGLALRQTPGLFLAGQINGTSGYEEAAAQGLVAGTNAAKWIQGEAPFVLGRHEAYIGVMVDDLILTSPREPYRMFSSRAEHRLLLRQDNADRRLVPLAHKAGLVGAEELARVRLFEERFEGALGILKKRFVSSSRSLFDFLRRPEVSWQSLLQEHPCQELVGLDPRVAEALEIEAKYEGYVRRQEETVERMARKEGTTIPKELNYSAINGLGHEAQEKLSLVRPATLGAAGRVEGVRPPDVALLAVHVERLRRQLSDAEEVSSSGAVQP
jgi:tRNA uridine 5-carboxymethylaminomethyl modification enzyme